MQKFLKLFGVTTRASTIVIVNNRPEMLVMAVNVGSKRFTQHGQVAGPPIDLLQYDVEV